MKRIALDGRPWETLFSIQVQKRLRLNLLMIELCSMSGFVMTVWVSANRF